MSDEGALPTEAGKRNEWEDSVSDGLSLVFDEIKVYFSVFLSLPNEEFLVQQERLKLLQDPNTHRQARDLLLTYVEIIGALYQKGETYVGIHFDEILKIISSGVLVLGDINPNEIERRIIELKASISQENSDFQTVKALEKYINGLSIFRANEKIEVVEKAIIAELAAILLTGNESLARRKWIDIRSRLQRNLHQWLGLYQLQSRVENWINSNIPEEEVSTPIIKPLTSEENYYTFLGVARNASVEEIRKAFRRIALQTHPDVVKGREEDFKKALRAVDILSDPNQRELYDRSI